MREKFIDKKLSTDKREMIDVANQIIEEYLSQGYRMTLRQLYYQFVSRALIPNNDKSYSKLGDTISDGRLCGLIDWDAIEDRQRRPIEQQDWTNLSDLVDAAFSAFRLPRWQGQPRYVELWVEKEALAGVLAPIAAEYHVTLMVNKGYCVDPNTRILTDDLTWLRADEIQEGMRLIAVDENVPAPRKHRKMRRTTVRSVCRFRSPRVRVHTDYGDIIVSANHPFLVTKKTSNGDNWHGYRWVEAAKIKPGWRIARLCDVWEHDQSYDAGWLAGIYDGEGCLPKTKLTVMCAAYQKPGLVADRIRSSLASRHLLGGECPHTGNSTIAFQTYGVDNVIRLLGSVRPIRLLDTFKKCVDLGNWPSKSKTSATVISVHHLNSGLVIGIETDAKTLITNGLVSHNSSQSAMYESAKRYLSACLGVDRLSCSACGGTGTCPICGGDGLECTPDEVLDERKGSVTSRAIKEDRRGAAWAANICGGSGKCAKCGGAAERSERLKEPILFYLGDHDPSGEHMVQDIKDRMLMFGVRGIRVIKLALTMRQVERYNPPPNPVKLTDSRAEAYIEKYGEQCWEVDALPPPVLATIIRDAFDRMIDQPMMDAIIAKEDQDKAKLRKAIAALE